MNKPVLPHYGEALEASDLWEVWPNPPVIERPMPRRFDPNPDEEYVVTEREKGQ